MSYVHVWCIHLDMFFIFRLTSSLYENGPVLRELVWKEAVTVGRWHHLAVSYVESLDGSTVTGKVSMDGSTETGGGGVR